MENMEKQTSKFPKIPQFICAVLTPFKHDLTLNLGVIPDYAKYIASTGLRAILVGGTTGEGMSLSLTERKQLTDAWLKASKSTKPNLYVQVQVGGASVVDVLEFAKYSADAGADSLLCLPDLYYKPKNIQDLIDYLANVSAAALEVPLYYYYNPNRSGVNYLSMPAFLTQSIGQIPTFAGIKYGDDNLADAYNCLKASDGHYTVILASNVLISAGYVLGFDTFMPSIMTVLPNLTQKIVEALEKNDLKAAKVLQDKTSLILKLISKDCDSIYGIKQVMNWFGPIQVGPSRAPLKKLPDKQITELKDQLQDLMVDV